MRQFISEILRIAELEIPRSKDMLTRLASRAHEYKDLVVRPLEARAPPDYAAIDSGYVTIRYRYLDLTIMILVILKNNINIKTIILNRKKDENLNINFYARQQEIKYAQEERGYVLLDGPLTPYVADPTGLMIGVSKDPAAARYWRGLGGEAGEWFREMSRHISELYGAELLLRGEPPGSMLRPVRVGKFLGTYIKGDSVFYVEFPEYIPIEIVSSFFKFGYPIKLRLAHKYAKISSEYLRTVKIMFSRFLELSNKYRDLL